MSSQQSRAVLAYRAQHPYRWAPFLAAWYAQYGETPIMVARVAREIAAHPDGPLARAYPADSYAHTGRALHVALGKAISALDGRPVPHLPHYVERGRYDTHRLAWYWIVRLRPVAGE